MAQAKRSTAQARGEARKKALIDAVIRLLAREGAAGVTHRAVAIEAGAKHGSARYYFSTRSALLREALNTIVLDQANEITALVEAHGGANDATLVTSLSAHVCHRITHHRDSELARYELFLAAARSGDYQATLNAWARSYIALFKRSAAATGMHLSDADGWRMLNLLNGLILQQLATPIDDFETAVLVPTLMDYFDLIRSQSAGRA